jgi:hypothetical protein
MPRGLFKYRVNFFQLHELIEFEKEKSILGGDREHLLKFEGNYSEGNYSRSKLERQEIMGGSMLDTHVNHSE